MRFGPLASNQSHTTGCGVKQNQVTGLQTGLGQGALEQILYGEALEHHGRAGVKIDVIGQFAHIFGGHDTCLAIAARRGAGIDRTVARFEVGDALAHGFHHTRGFHAQAMRQCQRVQTGAVVNINKVQTHGFVADADFTRAGLAHSDVDQVQLLWAAGLVEMNGFAHACLQCCKCEKENRDPATILAACGLECHPHV